MKFKQYLTIILSVLLFVSVLPSFSFLASAEISDYFTYEIENDEAIITKCDTAITGDVLIPSTLGGYPVTSIGGSAFNQCRKITSVIFPDSVRKIGNSAFYYCTKIKSIALPNNITEIGARAFFSCSALTTINIPNSVTKIADQTFAYCEKLESINLSENLTQIGLSAFFHCLSLTSIYIPEGVSRFEDYVFAYCESLTSIYVPESLCYSSNTAFQNAESLRNLYIKNIKKWNEIDFKDTLSSPTYYANNVYLNNELLTDLKIPSGVEVINEYAFANFRNVKNIYIPKSTVSIENFSFYNCRNIENIYYEGTAEEWAEVTVLSGNNYFDSATIYFNCTDIPGGAVSAEISKKPQKLKYIVNEENLDLAGGILTVNYEGGATQEIDLNTIRAEGFNNKVLGMQTLTIKYGEFVLELEVEIIENPIDVIAVFKLPQRIDYIVGDTLDITGLKIIAVFKDGGYSIIDATNKMVKGFNKNTPGLQLLTVTYLGHTTEFYVFVYEKTDFNFDGITNASDATVLTINVFADSGDLKYDVNSDGELDIIDLVKMKKTLLAV